MKQLRERGDAARYHGQIGRAQSHYTVDDYPLMQSVFDESLWPILQAPSTVVALARFSAFDIYTPMPRRSCGRRVSTSVRPRRRRHQRLGRRHARRGSASSSTHRAGATSETGDAV